MNAIEKNIFRTKKHVISRNLYVIVSWPAENMEPEDDSMLRILTTAHIYLTSHLFQESWTEEPAFDFSVISDNTHLSF